MHRDGVRTGTAPVFILLRRTIIWTLTSAADVPSTPANHNPCIARPAYRIGNRIIIAHKLIYRLQVMVSYQIAESIAI